jgi:tRNA nucleotidyltransferase/poly(A) polymerase
VHSVPRVVSSNLLEDARTKDFALNTIYYDPLNEIFIDPTGTVQYGRVILRC